MLFILILGGVATANTAYIVPFELKAQAYPAHVELSWVNRTGFQYEIYRSVNQGKRFDYCGTTTAAYYLDFFGKPVEKEQVFVYRILPKGLSVRSDDAKKFEVKVVIVNKLTETGTGKSKKDAEKQAAQKAWEILQNE